jgi:hypothetical protein
MDLANIVRPYPTSGGPPRLLRAHGGFPKCGGAEQGVTFICPFAVVAVRAPLLRDFLKLLRRWIYENPPLFASGASTITFADSTLPAIESLSIAHRTDSRSGLVAHLHPSLAAAAALFL